MKNKHILIYIPYNVVKITGWLMNFKNNNSNKIGYYAITFNRCDLATSVAFVEVVGQKLTGKLDK